MNLFSTIAAIIFLIYLYQKSKNDSHIIKYDCRDRKIYLILAIVFTLLTICMLALYIFPVAGTLSGIWLVFVTFSGSIFFPAIALLAWKGFLKSALYLRRLKMYGYEIPFNKRTFSSQLQNLSKIGESLINPVAHSRESIALSIISLSIFIGIIVNAIIFYFQHKSLDDLAYLMMQGSIPLLIFWLITVIVFWKQRVRTKYKDNVEIDDTRKNRTQLEDGIVEIFILLIVTLVWITLLYHMMKYMYKARLDAGYYK